MITLLAILNYLGTATSAMRASLTVTRRGADLTAALLLATIAGVGGGSARDLLIGAPIFWVHDQGYLLACILPATLVWFLGIGRAQTRLLDVLDAVGLGAYAVAGFAKAAEMGAPTIGCIAVGTLAATWGGIVRELLMGDPTVLARKEVYVTAALVSSVRLAVFRLTGLDVTAQILLAASAGAGVRLLAIYRNVQMPAPPWIDSRVP